jgi:hypothetical protein
MRKCDVLVVAGGILLSGAVANVGLAQSDYEPGLAGQTFNSEDFTQPDAPDILKGADNDWGDSRGNDWSASWYGFIEGPHDGWIEFSAEVNDGIRLRIGGTVVIEGLSREGARFGSVLMRKGEKLPLAIDFTTGRGRAKLILAWRWEDEAFTVVPDRALSHDVSQLPIDMRDDFTAANASVYPRRDDPFSQASGLAPDLVDLSRARIVVLGSSRILTSAAEMLRHEIDRRTRIDLEILSEIPGGGEAVIVIGTEADSHESGVVPPSGLELPERADGFALWQAEAGDSPAVYLIGHDERGALFAAGKLLRLLRMARDAVGLERNLKLATAPKIALRGHQMGYRPKTNSYDAWNLEMWKQYFRDMIVFGMNAVELVPPRTDDDLDSPHFPKPPMEIMLGQSALAEKYGLDVWIWYPFTEDDFGEPAGLESALRDREAVLGRLPKVDAVFVPSGDPGEVHPDQLFPLMEAMKEILVRHHPGATLWSSIQNYDDEPATMGWTEAFFEKLGGGQAEWLDGVVFGPATEITLPAMRANLPAGLPIRRYPDITHSKNCQYPVPDWDDAFKRTQGREIINPRPRAFASIFRENQDLSVGFITYSEGCNDDVNKVVWSSLGWNPDRSIEDILGEYSRYFIGPRYETAFARGLLDLESNWNGPLLENDGVLNTLERFREMETFARPRDKLNWRFQQGLYRAYFDATIKARLEYETELERQAVEILKRAGQMGSLEAMNEAEAILDRVADTGTQTEWRARVFELGEALYQSIRMQLSVPRYGAKEVGRGANLDLIDVPLNNGRQLKELFAQVRGLDSESQRLLEIAKIARDEYEKIEYDWEDIIERELRVRDGASRLLPNKVSDPAGASSTGLAGVICEKWDFREPAARDIIKHLNHNWTGGPGDWSAYYQGFIEGPFTGVVTLSAEADNGLRIMVGDTVVMDGLGRGLDRTGSIDMIRGEKQPFKVWYLQDGDPSYLRVYWSWEGREKVIVDEHAFSHSPSDERHAVSLLPWDFWSEEEAPFVIDASGRETLDLAYQHGRLLPAVGTENYQVVRSNREFPEWAGGLKDTYLHAPMLAYWNGRFYLEYLAAPVGEHEDPTVTLLTSSTDGMDWASPEVLFPAFLPAGDSHMTISHQRMGFYVSSDHRLLILSFYGRWPSPNEGFGIGRAVREIYRDGSAGPLYFIRYNRHAGWNESNTPFPFYRASPDDGFVRACDELMSDRLRVQQWWEEDRSEDGFYLMSGDGFKCKAFNWYTRQDGLMVGLFKAAWTAYSEDQGASWSEIRKVPSMIVGEAKMWGQQTEDGRYALVYNPHFEWRYPLVANVSDDGKRFGDMALIHGELPPVRYQGNAKDVGPQYVRGITQGNGDPPGDDLWLTYSMNKEDIWISRVPTPIRTSVDAWIDCDFDSMKTAGEVEDWNITSLVWAPVNLAELPSRSDKSLRFSDADPYDYARAQRVFPVCRNLKLSFQLLPEQSDHGRLEIDVLDRMGYRPVRLALTSDGQITAANGDRKLVVDVYRPYEWLTVTVEADLDAAIWSLGVDGRKALADAAFAEEVTEFQRVSFRTGAYRKLGIGSDENAKDLPNAGEPVDEAVYYLNNVAIQPR